MCGARDVNALYHFPLLHEGDCIYDILSSYHVQSLHFKSRTTSKELFGRAIDLRPSITLPYRTERINIWLGSDSNISARLLRERHSAWQFLQLSDEFSEKSLAPITSAEPKPGRRKQTRMRFVLQKRLGRLRYCPLCLLNDTIQEGEPFWHQVHQLYGVKYCPVHRIPLQDSNVNIEKPLYRYVPASTLSSNVSTAQLMEQASNLSKELDPYKKPYITLAKSIDWLLTHGLELGDSHEIATRYKKALGDNNESPLEGKKLVELMISIGGMGFLEELFAGDGLDEMLAAIMKEGIKALPPIGHALVVAALEIPYSWEEQ